MLTKYLLLLSKAKSIKSRTGQKSTEGFTLVELLVVVVIIGVLSAIALPNFLGQTAKAKQTEAKTTISSINRAQVAFRNEGNGFAKTIETLALGTRTSTANYQYSMSVSPDGLTVITTATPKDGALRAYTGGVVEFTNKANGREIATIMCEQIEPGTTTPANPNLRSGANTPEDAATCKEGQNPLL